MIIDPTNRQSAVNTYSAAKSADLSNSAGGPSFEAQLSSALAESLQKLGVGSGEVNITIRNPSATTRQILVTYSIDGSTPELAGTGTPSNPATASAPAAVGNPFFPTSPSSGKHIQNPASVAPSTTDWAPYNGPRDVRDQLAEGGGQITTSGAPLIRNNESGAANQYGYTGPATKNPYFTTPSNPLRDGYVAGFNKWFSGAVILGGFTGPMPANKVNYATEEGAQEALRIVQQFAPGAEITQSNWISGPFAVDTPMFEIDLGNGRKLNAGGVLSSYYNQGCGVSISSDETIRRAIQLA